MESFELVGRVEFESRASLAVPDYLALTSSINDWRSLRDGEG